MITLEKCPPVELLDQAVKTNDLEPLEHWFIRQPSPGYSFQTIADFVAEERSRKSKAKRAPSGQSKTRKARTTTKKEEVTTL